MCVWQDVSRAKYAALIPEAVVAPSAPTLKDEVDRKPEYPKPDTSQMIPFQPRHLAREHLLFYFACANNIELMGLIPKMIWQCINVMLFRQLLDFTPSLEECFLSRPLLLFS